MFRKSCDYREVPPPRSYRQTRSRAVKNSPKMSEKLTAENKKISALKGNNKESINRQAKGTLILRH